MKSITVDGVTFRFFDHLYAVSRNGLVLRKLEPYEPPVRPDGYVSVGRQRLLHRMVAMCWCDKPEGAQHVHHRNHNKQDNRASNLEWVTPKEHLNKYHNDVSRGHSMSEAGKQKLREFRTGKITSEETKQKQREASIRLGCKPPPPRSGVKLSPEVVAKMRANHSKNVQCEVFGIVYRSFTEAALALGERPLSLRKRCLSKNFPDYKTRE